MKTLVALLSTVVCCLAATPEAPALGPQRVYNYPEAIRYEYVSPAYQPQYVEQPLVRVVQQTPQIKYSQPAVQYVQQAPTIKYTQPAFQYTRPSVQYVQPVKQTITTTQPATQVKYIQPVKQTITAQPVPQLKYTQPSVQAYPVIAILRSSADINFDGSFNYDYQTENGISAQASGTVRNFGTKEATQVQSGSYSYTAPDGTPISVNWVADEFGFRAEGAHLPVAPPVPEAIARSLEYIRSLPPSKEDESEQKK